MPLCIPAHLGSPCRTPSATGAGGKLFPRVTLNFQQNKMHSFSLLKCQEAKLGTPTNLQCNAEAWLTPFLSPPRSW